MVNIRGKIYKFNQIYIIYVNLFEDMAPEQLDESDDEIGSLIQYKCGFVPERKQWQAFPMQSNDSI